jgi:hypothetical protein
MNRDDLDLDMYHAYIQENNIVDLYLMKKLSGEESARFEIHFLGCAKCIAQIEETEALRVGLSQAAIPAQTKPAGQSRRAGLFAWMSQLRVWQQVALSLAALLVVAALPTAFLLGQIHTLRQELNEAKATEPTRNAPQDLPPPESSVARDAEKESSRAAASPATAPPADQSNSARPVVAKRDTVSVSPQLNTPIFTFSTVRSDAPGIPNEIILTRTPQPYMISLDLEGESQYLRYRVTILRKGRAIWSTSRLRPNQLNMLTMTFGPDFLKVGDYQMMLEGLRPQQPAAPVADFRFRVTQQP